MIGGMAAAGGVGLMNQGAGPAGATGLSRVWGETAAALSSVAPSLGVNLFPSPRIMEAAWLAMLANATARTGGRLTLRTGCRLLSVSRGSGVCLKGATLDCGGPAPLNVLASVFVDASYDADVVVAAGGIDVAHGREGRDVFNESLAGANYLDDVNESFDKQNLTVEATFADGSLVPGVSAGPPPPAGTGDDRLMAFSYFACVTNNKSNSLPVLPPPGYNASDFTLLLRQIEGVVANGRYPAGPNLRYFSEAQYYATSPANAKLLLCCGVGPVNCDEPDLNAGYATATWAQRQAIQAKHRYYLQGSLYFMANDPRVPAFTRADVGSWGLCADEYVAHGNWPPQLYVRASNRLRGDVVLTQNTLARPRNKPDGVSCGDWEFDQHTMARYAVPDPRNASRLIARNEGYFRADITTGERCDVGSGVGKDVRCRRGTAGQAGQWYDVPFAAMLPQRAQASNLLVPVAISASSVAYASTRIEGMFCDLGTAAGVAAALALRGGSGGGACPASHLADTNVTAVQDTLVRVYGQRIHGPPA